MKIDTRKMGKKRALKNLNIRANLFALMCREIGVQTNRTKGWSEWLKLHGKVLAR